MWIFYIIISIILILVLVLLVFPVTIEIKDNIVPSYNKIKKYKSQSAEEKHFLILKLFKFITVYKVNLNDNKKKKNNEKLYKNTSNDPVETVVNAIFNALDKSITSQKVNKVLLSHKDLKNILESIYVKKLDLDFGINFINPIVNAYVLTLINVLINMFIAGYIDKFNLENTRYKTYLSGEVYNIKIHSIIEAKFANIIYIILKIKFKLRKVEKKNVRNKTSNRKFDDDSYDFTRKYGRC